MSAASPKKPSAPDSNEGASPRLGMLARLLIPVMILGFGVAGFYVLSRPTATDPGIDAQPQLIRTRVAELLVEDYPVTITTNGIVQAHNDVTLSSEVSGQVMLISPAFEVGSVFEEGEILVELDARDYRTMVDVAEAARQSAAAAVELAILNHDRTLKLADKNIVSEAEVNQASATRAQALAELDSAIARLDQAKRDLDRTKIRAPFDGRVRTKLIGVGKSVSPGTVLGEVFAIDYAEVRLPIAGRELPFLELPELTGDKTVSVTLRDAITETKDITWQAQIVRTEGTLDENSLELFAIARIEDPFGRRSGNPPLRIGQPVIASIHGKVLRDVVAIPRIAVRKLDQVILVDRKEMTLNPITISPLWSDRDHVIIESDAIEDGEFVSTTHLVYAPAGAKVEIIPDIEMSTADAQSSSEADTQNSNR